MKSLKRRFAPREVQDALDVLDEVGLEFDCEAFQRVRKPIEDKFLRHHNGVISSVEKGISPRQQVYFAIANLTGDYLESGEHHLYRGVLNPLGPGGDLLRLFDAATDRLLQSGAIDDKVATTAKAGIRESIKSMG